jgi:general nucleoside transport system permease protein
MPMPFRLERRPEPGPRQWLVIFGLTLAASLAVSSLLFVIAGADPLTGLRALLAGGFGSWRALAETLVRAAPLILTGLACAVAFRANIWNIGAEGQFYAGAMLAYWVYSLVDGLPPIIVLPAVLLAGMAGGALYASVAGLLRVRAAVDEVISTVMLNYIILFGLSLLLLHGPWSEAGGIYPQTARIADALRLPVLVAKTRLHAGILIALAAALVVHLMLSRSSLGYEIRAMGSNPRALRFKGTDTARLFLVIIAISGALAGLAGVGEVWGIHQRLKDGISGGVGYTGIIIAILARLHPLGVIGAAIFFGGVANGALYMQIKTGVPAALADAIQASILLLLLAVTQLARFRIVRSPHA